MKKKLLVLFIVVLVFALLFLVRGKSSDGGSISYRAVLYEVKQVHRQELGPYGEPSRLTKERDLFFSLIKAGNTINQSIRRCYPKMCFRQSIKAILIKCHLYKHT